MSSQPKQNLGEGSGSTRNLEQTMEIVRRVRLGESQADSELVRHSGGRILGLVMFLMGRKMRSRYDPEDVAQEVWLEVFKALRRKKGPTESFGPWVRKIATRKISQLQNRSDGQATLESNLPQERSGRSPAFDPPDPDLLPAVRSYRLESVARMVEELEQLEQRRQEIWTRYWFEEQSTTAIAREFDWNREFVRSELQQANRHLRHRLQERDQSDPADWGRPI
ncbi:MAG: sigma-70 family RNA polymerase sigma factor [Planctomycetota bacterium]|nr:MAG: sigma-70 family RNA polymerase sigma factor [Planctomycetota bacterium]